MIPYTDYECRLKLDELYRGDSVVLPTSEEHARMMIRVAEYFLNEQRLKTFKALAKDYEQGTN